MNNLIDKVKVILGLDDDSKDDLLSIYADNAKDYIHDFTRLEKIPETLESVIIDMVVYQYRRQGVESVSTQQMGGLYNSYIANYPDNIIKRLKPYKRALFL